MLPPGGTVDVVVANIVPAVIEREVLSQLRQQVGQDIYLQPMSSGAKQVVEIREISRRECPCTWSDDDG
jgi:hypothetical protein